MSTIVDSENYLIVDEQFKLLNRDAIKTYLDNICSTSNLSHLNTDILCDSIYPKLKSVNTMDEIDDLIVMCSTELATVHYDYPSLSMYILIGTLHDNTEEDYSQVVEKLKYNADSNGKVYPIISDDFYIFAKKYSAEINKVIDYSKDYNISLFGYRTLERSYLKRDYNGKIIERPQHMFMRVAIALHHESGNLDKIFETYNGLSMQLFTHATPTLFNAGTNTHQLSSCFLLGIEDDLQQIGECWKDCALISKHSGGIGINVSNIRRDGAPINSTQGKASGMRLLTVFNQIARYANQGGKRAGSFAMFIEPWHADINFFLDLKKNNGAETERARDLFLGLFVNDIFMERVEKNGKWSLMCPSECPNLINKYGKEFTRIYESYELSGKYIKQIDARDLWFDILTAQIETGTPYIMFKDAINYKSNHINLGVINGSNLCCEIVEYHNADSYAVCNLASICLPRFIYMENDKILYDYKKLYDITRLITRNLDNIIDINFYPVPKTIKSNMENRPIGIGVQGLADVFAIFKEPFDSEISRDLNKKIFETIYYAALVESNQIAKEKGHYSNFNGSPLSNGKFQFDLWNVDRSSLSGMWDWDFLELEIKKYGVSNSLVTACMPTASTSQIMGNNECFEPFTENIYTRNTLAGDFYIVNTHLMKDLIKLNLWNSDVVDIIKYHNGSIAHIPFIPDNIKKIYRTVWEIPQKSIIQMAADRGPFIDQTQSMNIFIEYPNNVRLTSCLFESWKLGLKTGMYYLRSKAAQKANQFGIDIVKIKELEIKYNLPPINNISLPKEKTYAPNKVCKFMPKHLRQPGDCIQCSA